MSEADHIHAMDPGGDADGCNAYDLLKNIAPSRQADVLRKVVDAVPDAIIVHGSDGHLLYFNESACKLLGYTQQEMSELRPFGWVAPHMMHGSTRRLEQILYEGEFSFESSVVRKDGTVVPTDVFARRADDSSGPMIVAVLRDVSERKEAQARLVYLAFHDSLTGLANRAALETRLRSAIADARRYHDMLAVAYIDLDRFKPVNDTHGHETGDTVLITIGERLTESVREQDMVARLGGDEFLVVLPRLKSIEELSLVAVRLLSEIRRPIGVCEPACEIDASIGFAIFDEADDDVRSLVVKADAAMYFAKRHHATPWVVWKQGMA